MTVNKPPFKIERTWSLAQPESQSASEDGPVAYLRHIGSLAWEHKAKLIFAMICGVLIAGLYAASLPKIYRASATLLLEPGNRSAVSGLDTIRQDLDLARVDSESEIIRSERLLMTVFNGLRLDQSLELAPKAPGTAEKGMSTVRGFWSALSSGRQEEPASVGIEAGSPEQVARRIAFQNFQQRLDVRRIGQTYVIAISYSSADPQIAASVANAAASAYLWQTIDFKYQMATAGAEMLQGRLDALSSQVKATQEAIEKGVLPTTGTPDGDARVIGAAQPPLSPYGVSKSVLLALGGVVGLLLGISYVAVTLTFDRRVHKAKALSKETGLPCIGLLPKPRQLLGLFKAGHEKSVDGDFARAVHDLRTFVEVACVPIRRDRNIVVAIVGWESDDDTIKLGWKFGEITSRSGRKITLFAGEARGRSAHSTSVGEKGQLSLADAVVTRCAPDDIHFSEVDGMRVMPIHSAYPETNLYADFHDPQVRKIIETSRAEGDTLLVLPPFGKTRDALALAAFADVVLVVATAGKTNLDDVTDLIERLGRSGANVIGTVINGT